jgi:putative hydrolase of HD superfamily
MKKTGALDERESMNRRLHEQIQFLMEIDKLKHVFRRTKLLNGSRYENDAEHAWHLAMMAIVLHECSNEPVELLKVVKMVLIHDVVEIDAGDAFLYDDNNAKLKGEAETKAAIRVFGLLPEDQRREFINLWEEFERKETPEAKFAAALDRLEPLIQNAHTEGHAWIKYGITKDQVISKNRPPLIEGSEELWGYAEKMIEESADKDYFAG